MKRKLVLSLLACILCIAHMSAASPKREFRSVWLSTVWNIDWPPQNCTESSAKAELIEYLDALEGHNFTGVCLQVRGLADAMYKSSYEPWSSALGARGSNPGWDPLAYAVEECHKRGLECYAWVNPYRITSGTTYNTSYDKEWRSKGWELVGSNGKYVVFNPAMAECRAHILKVIKEIYTNYAIDGMLFDDYFYPSGGTSTDSKAADYSIYKNSGTNLSLAAWRRKNINDFMTEIYNNVQNDRPDMRFGISPAGVGDAPAASYGLKDGPGSDWQYDEIYSEPLYWLKNGIVDFISPQLYWPTDHSTNPFASLSKWWSTAAEKFGRHFYASHDTEDLGSYPTSEFVKQVNAHRDGCSNNAPGAIYFSACDIDGIHGGDTKGLGSKLESEVYTGKSLVPVVDWKNHATYGAPTSLAFTGQSINWSAVSATANGNFHTIIRYTVYAIPEDVTLANARAADGDGIDSKYLLGVSYNTTYTIPAEKREGYYYAVCVYDGYGYEYEPATTLKELEPSTATTLISPKGGELVDWEATFKWNSVSDAVYALEISKTADFATLLYQKTGITSTSITVDLSSLSASTRYYWRVATLQPDKKATESETESFTTGTKPYGSFEDGYTLKKDPAEYILGGYDLENLWMRSTMSNFNNFANWGEFNRGMVATENYVYITGRSAASASATIYLSKFNALTGEHEGDIILYNDGGNGGYPCNDIIKDSKGNLLITNLYLESANYFRILQVDVTDGSTSELISLRKPSARIDHAGVYGDVTTGNYYVFAVGSSTSTIYRWKVTDGEAGSYRSVSIEEFSPVETNSSGKTTEVTQFGAAPKVLPISETQVYVDGGNTYMTLYDFSDGSIIDELYEGHTPAIETSNGQAIFDFDNKHFAVFSARNLNKAYAFNVITSETSDVLNNGQLLLTIPEGSLGSNNTTTLSAPCDAIVVGDEARIYVYTPLNGLAGYTLKKKNGTSSISSITQDECRMTIYDNVVTFENSQEFIKAYNTAGMLVASVVNSDELALPSTGNYIIVTSSKATKVAIR